MCAATMYVMRAIHRDLGVDLNELNESKTDKTANDPQRRSFYGSIRTQFFYRLWPVIGAPTSPLAEAGGPVASFNTTHDYLTGKTFTEPQTSELYQTASKVYGVARQWIKTAGELGSTETNLGPVDSFDQLDHVAKNNDIVCRLLAARPEKRPKLMEGRKRGKVPSLLSPSMPVQLDFSHLPSRVYPLLRLR